MSGIYKSLFLNGVKGYILITLEDGSFGLETQLHLIGERNTRSYCGDCSDRMFFFLWCEQ